MRTDPRPDAVRELVREVFAEIDARDGAGGASGVGRGAWGVGRGASSANDTGGSGTRPKAPRGYPVPFSWNENWDSPQAIEETILIDEGRYVARCYKTDRYMAMWLVEVGLLEVYSEAGEPLATINLFRTLEPQRMAA
ncbi:MAG: hypothetical protein ABSG68_19130 [Thermoguttaceae bacterium]